MGRCLYEHRRNSIFNTVLNIIFAVFALLLLAEIMFNAYFISILVDGRSMMPTLNGADIYGEGGDYIYVNKHAQPDYGDIVVVEVKNRDTGTSYNIIKRVVAFGGDTVKLENGVLYIKYSNGGAFVAPDESYLFEQYNNPELPENTFPEHKVAEGCMFLLGDNRNESADSRYNGDYPVENLVGVMPDWSLEHKQTITAFYTFLKNHSISGKKAGIDN